MHSSKCRRYKLVLKENILDDFFFFFEGVDLDSLVKFTSDVRWMNACFMCAVCGHKASGVARKDSDVILCFVHPALFFWKVIVFTEESDVLVFEALLQIICC